MAFRDFMELQRDGMRSMAGVGVIGLHLVSGPAVGFALGFGLDKWLGTTPWCGLACLLVGIGAGFLNVWQDTRNLMRKMDQEKQATD